MQILQLLVQQFNVVLFYENDFNERLLCVLSEMLQFSSDDATLKTCVSSILSTFHEHNSWTLEVAVQKLDPLRKAPLQKIIIELDV